MPAAKKPTTGTSGTRSRNGTPAASRAATRRDVERQIARVEKLLSDAGDALQLLGKDMGRGAGDAYKELVRTAKALRRDAQRTNKRMLKDFDKLRGALTPSVTDSTLLETNRKGSRRPNGGRTQCVSRRDSLRPRSHRGQLEAVNRRDTHPRHRRRGELDPDNPRDALSRHPPRRWL